MPVARPLQERFWEKVARDPDSECWVWIGSIATTGYGRICAGGKYGKQLLAHRVAHELLIGPIPEGLHIDHLCKNRCCVSPAHIEAVTQAENNRRSPNQYAHRQQCKHGHPFTGDNFYVNARGTRICRVCGRIRNRAQRAALV